MSNLHKLAQDDFLKKSNRLARAKKEYEEAKEDFLKIVKLDELLKQDKRNE